MAEETTSAKLSGEPEPEPESAAAEAEKLIRRGSGGRWVLRVLIGVGLVGLAVGGGYLGYRAMLRKQAKDTPMKRFPAALAQIGNDLWPDEGPAHEVELKSYWLDVNEVTVNGYRVCVEEKACTEPAKGGYCNWKNDERGEDHPINCVNYDQADTYCKWAGKRLPTEKEWEHAARTSFDKSSGPLKDLFPWGAGMPSPKIVNACGGECRAYFAKRGKPKPAMYEVEDGFPVTAPVGSFPEGETKEGLRDMAGNVWEWTKSPFCVYPDEECGNSTEFVIRGGGYQSFQPRTLEVTSREALPRTEATDAVGFRCAKDG